MNHNWLDRLRHYLPQISSPGRYPPLLDMAERQALQAFASQPGNTLIQFDRSVTQQQLGDRLSRFRGQGFEFEENRRYQQGDEQRLINWRLFARRGELFTKTFVEERRPEVHVLIDRRASMRFGTHIRLKATLAAQLATVTLLQAHHQFVPCGGVVLDDEAQWFTPALGHHAISPLLEAIAAPCPPQPFEQEQESLQQVLFELGMRLTEGSFILLLSDFADLDTRTVTPALQRLTERHTVQAIQIRDIVETELPDIRPLLIEDNNSDQALVINDDNDYRSMIAKRQTQFLECFTQSRINLFSCYAHVDWQQCLQRAVYGDPVHE